MSNDGSTVRAIYLEKIAIGEGCGCAEQAIGMLDMEARSLKIAARRRSREPAKPFWSWFLDILRRQRAGNKYEADHDVN